MKILSAASVRRLEADAIASGAATAAGLMSLAVAGCLEFILSRHDLPKNVLVLAGKGHNGNDALLLASQLRAHGWRVETILTDPPEARARMDLEGIRDEETRARVWSDRPEWSPCNGKCGKWTVVDGLLGSGVSGAPRGAVAEILLWLGGIQDGMTCVALDFPSGMDPDTGEFGELCFAADWTMAIGAVKPGCLVDAARKKVGRLVPIPLDLDWGAGGEDFVTVEVGAGWILPLSADVHKYRKGEVVVWAGSPGMGGAAVLASRAALHAGAGVVRLYTHPDLVPQVALATPEVMVSPVSWDGPLPEKWVGAKVILAGPGIGRSPEAAVFLRRLVEETCASLLLDADALHLLAAQPELLGQMTGRACVLTPHAGELAVLNGVPVVERRAAADYWHQRHSRTVLVAKGPNTLVMDGDGRISFNGTGHPGMATAGMGDVLSGVIAALLARGYSAGVAARLGVCWHGLAADRAAARGSETTLTAGEVICALGTAWRELEARKAG
jgi:ADP-dependent NAD(P)H-hydrate dehydratase / NAD(P)H-hydrate epimerase